MLTLLFSYNNRIAVTCFCVVRVKHNAVSVGAMKNRLYYILYNGRKCYNAFSSPPGVALTAAVSLFERKHNVPESFRSVKAAV